METSEAPQIRPNEEGADYGSVEVARDAEGQIPEAAPEQPAESLAETPQETPQVDQLKIEQDNEPSDLFSGERRQELYNELQENNWEWSEEHYKEFEGKGLSRQFADEYLAGQRARAEQVLTYCANECGGVEAMQEALNWAAKNLSPQAVEATNAQLRSMDPEVVVTAMRGLQARAGVGLSSVPGSSGEGSINYFADESEFRSAMSDERFDKSPAYRNEVQEKLRRSVERGTVSL